MRAAGWPAALALALLAACGGDSAAPTGRSLDAPAAARRHGANAPPRIERVALEPLAPLAGSLLEARVEAFDPDGDAVRPRYAWTVDGRRASARGAVLAVPDVPKGTPIELEVVVGDGRAESEPARVAVRVGNRAPVLVHVRLEPETGVQPGQELVARAAGRDPDGDPLRYRFEWRVNGEAVGGDGDRLATAGLRRGDRISVRVAVSDGEAWSAPLESAVVSVGNRAPEITSRPPRPASDGVLRYTVAARDPDGDRELRFALVEAPEGAAIDARLGRLVWRAKPAQLGTHPIEVAVDDGHGGRATQRFDVTVRAVEPSVPPVPAGIAPPE
jgi:hypothetical protein